jgi:arabinan endo-1,5-alpha-L-arabinosidase
MKKKNIGRRLYLLISLFYLLTACTNVYSSSSSSSFFSDKVIVETDYINPIYNSRFADPSIILVDDTYYAFATEGNYISSKDLVNWQLEGNVLMYTGSPLWGSNGANVWAPHLIKIQNKYMFYYALSSWGDANPGIGYNYIEDITQFNWEPGAKLFTSNEIGVNNSIDPFVIEDNNSIYLVWGSFQGIYIVELNESGTALKGSLTEAKNSKMKIAGSFEGAWIQKKEDYYYLYLSRGSCCNGLGSTYNVVVFRSTSLFGPYLDENGVNALNGGGYSVIHSSDLFIGPGHNAVISDVKGNDWLIYHSYTTVSPNARLLCLDLLIYEDGWPSVLNNVPSSSLVKGPAVYL